MSMYPTLWSNSSGDSSGGHGGAREGVTDAIEQREEDALSGTLPDKVSSVWVREDEEDEDGLVIHSTKSSACCGSTRPAAENKDERVQRPRADEDAPCPRPALLPLDAEPACPRDSLPLLVVLPDIPNGLQRTKAVHTPSSFRCKLQRNGAVHTK